jgi:hypothetical protein
MYFNKWLKVFLEIIKIDIMEYLHQFANLTAYNTAKGVPTWKTPGVSLIKDDMHVEYDPIPAKIGDCLYSDKSFSSTYNPSKTPIAVCVAPAAFFADGKARWMSLVNMSLLDPENGTKATGNDGSTNPGAGIYCGGNGVDLSLTNFNGAPFYAESEGEIGDSIVAAGTGYLGIQYYSEGYEEDGYWTELYDGVYVENDDNHNPCLINAGGSVNDDLRVATFEFDETTYYNPLSDVNGALNTATIIAAASATETVGAITNSYAEGHYPQAMACHRFYTAGTQAGDWYQPAMGELAFVGARLDTINTTLEALDTLAVPVGDYDTNATLGFYLWSSSGYGSYSAWGLGTDNGGLFNYNKYDGSPNYRVRAFLAL